MTFLGSLEGAKGANLSLLELLGQNGPDDKGPGKSH